MGLKKGKIGETLVNYLDVLVSLKLVLKYLEKKNLGKCTAYLDIEVIPRHFCPAFRFPQF